MDPFADLTEMTEAIRDRRISSTALVQQALARADELDPTIGTFLARFDQQALASAAGIDAKLAQGIHVGPLAGVPVAVKDYIATREGPTTGQSLVHDPDWWKATDATVVQSLRKAGAVIIGKTSMAEHAAGRPDPKMPFPLPRNPWDIQRWTGGSSTGTANGIATGLFPAGLGTDTAGSVRIPAAMCGITGFKPTHGLLPMDGCLPASRTLDVVGPMARSARDCALLLRTMAPGSALEPSSPLDNLRGTRIGVPWQLIRDPARAVEASVLAAFEVAVSVLEGHGAEVTDFPLQDFDALMASTMIVMVYEMYRVHEPLLASSWSSYGRSFRRLAAAGGLLAADDYAAALRTRTDQVRLLQEQMAGLDALAMPTWGSGAPRYQGNGGIPPRETNFTAPWNGAGFPALALPMGFDEDGLPLSLQLVGSPNTDHRLLELGIFFQKATDWHTRRPDTSAFPAAEPVPDLDGLPVPDGTSVAELEPLLAVGIVPDAHDSAVIIKTAGMLRASCAVRGESPAAAR